MYEGLWEKYKTSQSIVISLNNLLPKDIVNNWT